MKIDQIPKLTVLSAERDGLLECLDRIQNFRHIEYRVYFNGHECMDVKGIRNLCHFGLEAMEGLQQDFRFALVERIKGELERVHKELIELGVEL